jgi:hypothetical protein
VPSCKSSATAPAGPTQHAAKHTTVADPYYPAESDPTYVIHRHATVPQATDHILETLVAIKEEQLCMNITSGDWRIWETAPWDPTSWELPETFVRRWWFLLDEDMTNLWR